MRHMREPKSQGGLEVKQLVVITIIGTIPQDITMPELKDFAKDALSTMGGCRHPDDLLFGSIELISVTATRAATVTDE